MRARPWPLRIWVLGVFKRPVFKRWQVLAALLVVVVVVVASFAERFPRCFSCKGPPCSRSPPPWVWDLCGAAFLLLSSHISQSMSVTDVYRVDRMCASSLYVC